MGKSDSDDERKAGDSRKASVSLGCSFITVLLAFFAIIISVHGLRSQSVWIVDRLLKFNLSYDAGATSPVLTTRIVMLALLISSTVLGVTMLIGLAGAFSRNKVLTAIASTVAFICSIHMLGSSAFMLTRYEMVTPTVYRQIDFLCNTTNYARLSANMDCSWVSATAKILPPACSQVCKDRVRRLLELDGCEVLPKLCNGSDIVKTWWGEAVLLSVACIITAVMLICTTTSSCCLLYSINISRRGKPSAEGLCCLLMCPCCPGDSGKGFTEIDEEEFLE